MRARLALTTLLALALSSGAFAQITTATISGVLKDQSGGVLPGVDVTVRNLDTGATRSVVTDANGSFTIPGLPPGTYESRAELQGFSPAVQSGIVLTVGQQAVLNLTMAVGAAAETIEVRSTVSLVDVRNSALSAVIEERQIEQLPLNGRNFIDLALAQPGVQAFRTRQTGGLAGRGQQLNINGATGRSNSYLLDGANMKSYHGVAVSTAADTTLGVETVREFRVVTNAFSADYGRAMGGVINVVTKAGSNDLHGSAFEFFRDSAMDARNFFDPGEPPPFTRHQFGFTAGGPVVRDRTFFFGGGEWLKESLGLSQVTTVPNVAARTGGLGPIDPATRRYLDLMPLPNGPDLGGGLARLTFPFDRRTDETFLQGRVDHSFTRNDTSFIRYTLDRAERRLPTSFPQFANRQESTNQFLTAEAQHIFGQALLSTARVSYSRLRLGLRLLTDVGSDYAFMPGQPTMGVINIGGMPGFGPDSTSPQDANTDYLTFSDDVAYTKGRHFLKTGVLVERAATRTLISTNVRASYQFPGVQQFLANAPSLFSGVLPGAQIERDRTNMLVGLYAQDDFTVHPRLTLNLGVRYELFTVPKDNDGRDSALRDILTDAAFVQGPLFRNPSLRNVGPRAGFAWDVNGDGRTSIRGGAGLYYDTDGTFNSALLISTFSPPFAIQVTLPRPTFPHVSTEQAVQGRAARTIDYHVGQPRMLTGNLNIQREVAGNLVLMIGYAGSRGHDLVRAIEGNPVVPQIAPGGTKFFPAGAPRRNPNWGPIDFRTTGGRSWYDALQVSARKRFSQGYQWQVSYTWGKMLDETQGQLGLDAANDSIYPADPYDSRSERGIADPDIRHNLSFNFSVDVPTRATLTGPVAALLRGWQLNGLGTLRSGVPFTPYIVTNWSRSGNTSGQDRPNLKAGVKPSQIILGSPTRYFDPNAFELQPAGFLGNAGRNILTGPKLINFDLSLVKSHDLFARGRLQFRFEVFNVFNRPNFSIPDRVVFSGAREGEAPLPTAGQIRSTITDARQLQLGVKLTF